MIWGAQTDAATYCLFRETQWHHQLRSACRNLDSAFRCMGGTPPLQQLALVAATLAVGTSRTQPYTVVPSAAYTLHSYKYLGGASVPDHQAAAYRPTRLRGMTGRAYTDSSKDCSKLDPSRKSLPKLTSNRRCDYQLMLGNSDLPEMVTSLSSSHRRCWPTFRDLLLGASGCMQICCYLFTACSHRYHCNMLGFRTALVLTILIWTCFVGLEVSFWHVTSSSWSINSCRFVATLSRQMVAL